MKGANRIESCHEGIGEADRRGSEGYHCGVIVVTGQKSF